MEVSLHEHREHRRTQRDGAYDTQRHQRRLPRRLGHARVYRVLQRHRVLQPARRRRGAQLAKPVEDGGVHLEGVRIQRLGRLHQREAAIVIEEAVRHACALCHFPQGSS